MKHFIIEEITNLAEAVSEKDDFLMETAKRINYHFPQYIWAGFYFLEKGQLHLGPYIGKFTPHTVIDLNQGICGAAISRKETIIVDDVNADPRYLACSLETKSEIVIPIRVNGKIIGELDIDSDKLAAFSGDDKELLEQIVEIIGRRLAKEN